MSSSSINFLRYIIRAFCYYRICSAMEKLIKNQRIELLSAIRLSLDLIQAGSTLPKGYLWGGKLQVWQVGLVGALSAVIGFLQYFAKKKKMA